MKLRKTKKYWLQNIFTGIQISLGIALGLGMTGLLAVAVTGTFNSFTSGAVIKSTEVNTNIATLKTAIEGITSSQWTTSGANIGYTAGNVGIGTSSPVAKLTITQAAETNTEGIRINDGATIWNIFANTGGRLNFTSTGGANIAFQDDGKVGLGTTSPSYPLTVTKSSYADGEIIAEFGASGLGSTAMFRAMSLSADVDRMGIQLTNHSTGACIWRDNATDLRVGNCSGNTSNTDGTVIGTQTSTRESKQDILKYAFNEDLLKKLLKVQLHTFKYKKEVAGYGDKAKRKLGFIADEVDPLFMDEQGKSIDQVSVNGILIGAIQEQNKEFSRVKAEGEQTFARLRELQSENAKLREEITALRQSLETHGRASLRLEERLRAVENTHMAKK